MTVNREEEQESNDLSNEEHANTLDEESSSPFDSGPQTEEETGLGIDEDNVTVIAINELHDEGLASEPDLNWLEHPGTERETHRRNVLLRELRRVQRASFMHFLILCLIPVVLLVVVLVIVSGSSGDGCQSETSFCEIEERSFLNAFTTRCVCDAIPVHRYE